MVDAMPGLDEGPARRAPWKVELTGHSLGGALATLAAYDFGWNKLDRDQRRQSGCVGQPCAHD